MAPETLSLIAATNSKIAAFLTDAPRLLASAGEGSLAEISSRIEALQEPIADTGRSLGPEPVLDDVDAERIAAVRVYEKNLETLKSVLIHVQSLADAHRHTLLLRSPALAGALAWSQAARMTLPK